MSAEAQRLTKRAKTSLQVFAKDTNAYDEATVDRMAEKVRSNFVEAGYFPYDSFGHLIRDAQMHLHGIGAAHALEEFEKPSRLLLDQGSIHTRAEDILSQFAASGRPIDDNLVSRVALAEKTAQLNNAERRLLQMEHALDARSPGEIVELGSNIRKQFVAGGAAVTDDNRLPAPLEARLERVTGRSKAVLPVPFSW
jgi:hypothetical protein